MKNQKQQGELLVIGLVEEMQVSKRATFLNPRLCSGGCVIKSSSNHSQFCRIYSESQGTSNSQDRLEKQTKQWRICTPHFKTYYKAAVIKQCDAGMKTHRATEQNGEPRGLPSLHQATLDKDTVTTHSCLPEFSGGSHHITQSTASSQPQRIQATLVASMTSSPLSL